MQKEIGFAQDEVKTIEDKVLERMLEADDLTAAVKRAETGLAAEQKAVAADRRSTTAGHGDLLAAVERMTGERAQLVAAMDKEVLALFEAIARKRNGIAVAEARGGVCTICHVRLRPQVFNSVRRNDSIMQCDHCNRILYFVPAPAQAATPDGATQSSQ
ncbi:MAG: hypothetical protein E6K11_02750 [Methanobacteriota archaeon]|nr:MAG: hypothetical protein E6K11_02750 [Euryarchaeota archaeon]